MDKRSLITIGIPCFNEEKNVVWAYETIKKIILKDKKNDFEFVFVDNGSEDKTRLEIEKVIKKDKNVKGVFLSRNFGPEASAQACIDNSTGNAIILLACDLQDPPELIPKFIERWNQGFDIVLGQYKETKDSIFMTFMRKSFYGLFKKISNIDVPTNVTGFGLISRNVVEALKNLPEKYRFSRGLMMWVGFKKTFVSYQRRDRKNGKSSYNFFDYLKHSERGVFGFSYLPLDLIVYIGLIITLLSFLFIIGYLFMVFVFGNPINASIPILLAIVFFGGVNLMALSIIGKYIQVIVEETKNRPVYIVDKKINFKN
ncbi:MAG: glycosyltransferase family 2 protein [Candidatus Shapirobacteria bacterium]|nr:glycosyltransferase family 2 protein [Candidatus Shapirobacteria bacterium]